jgi:TonB-linked SusC/RagA family outer membrane protein
MKKYLLLMLMLIIAVINAATAQTTTITGKVTSADDGLPLPGVTVKIKGSNIGTQTDQNGVFQIKGVPISAILTFVYIGYVSQEIIVGDKTNPDIKLKQESRELSEVVVTGYQSKIRTDLSSSISVVSSKEIADKPIPSVDNLLQGKAAGVQVITQNGKPGGNAFIRIRGTGSVNGGSEPLLVVDGVQIPDATTAQFYTTLNANDIQSISVLKDAAAVSLYGARGSNGVVLITTKTGTASDSRITYSFQYGLNRKIPDNFKLMTPAQKLQYEFDLGYENSDFSKYLQNNGFPDTATLFNVTSAQRQAGWNALIRQSHNWLDDILQTGKIIQHQVSLSGHDGKTNYYISFQKFFQGGITVGSSFNRYTGKINLSTAVKPWFTFSNNLNLGQSASKELRDIYNAQNPFYAIYAYNPYEPVYNADGSYNLTSQGFSILEALKNNPENKKFIDGYNTTVLDFHPIKGLNVSTQFGMTYDDYKRQVYIKPGSVLDTYIGDPTAPGEKTDNGSTDFDYDWVNKIIYKFDVAGDHHINILGVQEFQKDILTTYSLSRKGFATGDLSTQDAGAANDLTNSTSESIWTIASLLGELDYNYKNKYYATGSFRRDGSSRFGTDNKYGNFYSASLSWLINQEDFMKQFTWLNILKLRGSIGTSGNFSGLTNYQSLYLYGFGTYNNLLTSFPSQIPNPNLTWEKKLKRDIGLDFEVFGGRVSGSFEYYNENTTSLLFLVPVSETSGFGSVFKNVGALYNRGIDASLNVDVLRIHGFTWSVNGNMNYNQNKVTQLYGGADEIDDANALGVVKPGYAVNTFKLVRYAGVNPQTGAAQFYDKNGNITENYSSDDAVILKGKSPNPKFFGGFGTKLSYNGIELSADFTYTVGNYIYNINKSILDAWGDEVYINQAVDALNYWKKPGDIYVLPKASIDNVTYTTDQYLQEATYIRLRSLSLSYTLPKAITQKYKIQSLQIFGTAENLWTINPHHFFGDPEVGIGSAEGLTVNIPGQATLWSYPSTRQFTFGVNITF